MTPAGPHPLSRRQKHLLYAAGIVTAAVLIWQAVRKSLREHGCDLDCYLGAARAMLAGQTPYDANAYFEYPYPPFFAAVMTPLTLLPVVVTATLWGLLNTWCVFYATRQLRRLVRGTAPIDTADLLSIAVLAAMLFRVLHANFANGQCNLLLVAMCMAFVGALTRGRDRAAGIWLALAVQFKMMPAVLLAMLVLRRRWRALAWCGGALVATSLLPIAFVGAQLPSLYTDWLAMIQLKLERYTIDGGTFTVTGKGVHEFFSLRGMLASLWPATSASHLAKYACVGAVIGTATLLDMRRRQWPERLRDPACMSIWLGAALLIEPMSEKHHLALLLPALALAAFARRRGWQPFAAAVFACMMLAKAWPAGPWMFATIPLTYAWLLRERHQPRNDQPDASTNVAAIGARSTASSA